MADLFNFNTVSSLIVINYYAKQGSRTIIASTEDGSSDDENDKLITITAAINYITIMRHTCLEQRIKLNIYHSCHIENSMDECNIQLYNKSLYILQKFLLTHLRIHALKIVLSPYKWSKFSVIT